MRNGVKSLAAFTLLLLFLSGSTILAQNSRGMATKENLDLPFDALGNSEDEEEAPEIVYFYGQQFEGDGIFFCLDRSSSTCNGELAIEKREAIRTVTQFSNRVEFAIVFYDAQVMRWPTTGRPARADAAQRAAAVAFLSTVICGRGTCTKEGLLAAVDFADRATTRRNVIIYLGDGRLTCPTRTGSEDQYRMETLQLLVQRNHKRHQINSICVGGDEGPKAEQFCRDLAGMHHGKFTRIWR